MGLLDTLKSLFSGKGGGGDNGRAMYFYVRCKACGEKIRVRVDKYNDLQQEFDENDRVSGYTLDKDVLGNKCFRMMHLHVEFDSSRRIIEQSVENGVLISKDEFLQEQ